MLLRSVEPEHTNRQGKESKCKERLGSMIVKQIKLSISMSIRVDEVMEIARMRRGVN